MGNTGAAGRAADKVKRVQPAGGIAGFSLDTGILRPYSGLLSQSC